MNNRIQNIRVWRNLTQEELAEKANIAVSTLRRIEKNQEYSKYTIRKKIADVLDYPLKDLFWKDDKK